MATYEIARIGAPRPLRELLPNISSRQLQPRTPSLHASAVSYYTGSLACQVGTTQRPGIIAQLSSYHLYLSRWNKRQPPA